MSVDALFDELISGGDGFDRLQLYGNKSSAVAEGKIPMGHFGIPSGESIIDVGPSIDCYVMGYRPKAVEYDGETVFQFFDMQSEEFKRIRHRADNEQNSGCFYGPDYLLWLPERQKYVTFLFGSRSARQEARILQGLMEQWATLQARLIKKAKYSWHVPVASACSTPYPFPSEGFGDRKQKFLTAQSSNVKALPATTTSDGRVR